MRKLIGGIILSIEIFGSVPALACVDFIPQIRQTNASYKDETFHVSGGDYGPQIAIGDSAVFFNFKVQKWCIRALESTAQPQCLSNDGGSLVRLRSTKDNRTNVGQLTVGSDNTLLIFSVDENGQRANNQPYMRITNSTRPVTGSTSGEHTGKLKFETVNSQKIVDGVFEYNGARGTFADDGRFELPGGQSRGGIGIVPEAPPPSAATTINGFSSVMDAGCSNVVRSEPMGSSTGTGKPSPSRSAGTSN